MRHLMLVGAAVAVLATVSCNAQQSEAPPPAATPAADAGAGRSAAPPEPFTEDLVLAEDIRAQTNGEAGAKIIGGSPVAPGTFPFVVGVARGLNSSASCTGSLIERDVVLTAAHCLCSNVNGQVYIGDHTGRPGGRYVRVRASKHGLSQCNPMDLNAGLDLAVLLLEQPVANVTPVAIAPASVIDSARSYRAVGFGAIDQNAQVFTGEKREAKLTAVSNSCTGVRDGRPDSFAYGCAAGHEIVAGRMQDGTDTCNGDSGGPLLVSPQGKGDGVQHTGYLLAGATSRATKGWVKPCGEGGIYERLDAAAQAWIKDAVAGLRAQP